MKALYDGINKEGLGGIIIQTQNDLIIWSRIWRFLDPLEKYTIKELMQKFEEESKNEKRIKS